MHTPERGETPAEPSLTIPPDDHTALKLYVWDKVFRDYSTGLAVALAHDAEEARQMLVEMMGYSHADLVQSPQMFDPACADPVAFYVYGGS